MALTERLALLISADVDGAVRGLEKVGRSAERNLGLAESKLDRTSARLKKFGAGALGAAGLAAAGLYKAGQAASDLEQAVGGTEAVFGDAAEGIEKFAKTAAQSMGLSERAFREATTSIGGQLKRMTGDVDFAAEQSIELTKTAADLAATYGGTTAEAVQALGAALRGEADPAERFNLNLKISAVNAKAVALSLAESTNAVDDNARAHALLALVAEQSADAQGQFARESDTAAGASQRASASMENAMAALGEAVAPIIADVADGLATVANKFTSLNEASGGVVSKFAVLGTAAVGSLGAIALVAGKVIDLSRSLRDAEGNLTRTGSALRGLGRAAAAIGILTVAVEALNAAIPDPRKADLTALQKALLDLGETGLVTGEAATVLGADLGTLKGAIEDIAAPSIAGQLGNVGAEIITFGGLIAGNLHPLEQAEAAIDALDKSLAALAAVSPKAAAEAMAQLKAQLTPEEFARLLPLLDDYTLALDSQEVSARASADATDEAAGATSGYTSEVKSWAEAQEEANGAVEAAIEGLKELSKELKSQFDPLFGLFDAQNDLADAQLEVVAAEKEHGKRSKEYERALQDLAKASLDYEAAAIDLAAAVDAGEVSLDTAADTLNRWASQGFITGQQAAELAARLGLIVDEAGNVARSNPEFEIREAGVDEALAKLQALKATLTGLDGTVGTITTRTVDESGSVRAESRYFLASGGPVPGAKGEPVPGIAHGGEFVLSADVVDAIRRGAPTQGLGTNGTVAASSSGPALHIENFYASDRPTVEELDYAARRQQLMAM